MRANVLNYIAAGLFFATAIRDWFFPGALELRPHNALAGEVVVWLVMGFACIAGTRMRADGEKNR